MTQKFSLLFYIFTQYIIKFALSTAPYSIDGKCFKNDESQSFQRGYILSAECYQMSRVKGNTLMINENSYEQKYPIFWNSNGLQSHSSFSLYNLDIASQNFTIKVYEAGGLANREYQVKAKEIKHASCSQNNAFYFYYIDLSDQWQYIFINIAQQLTFKLPSVPQFVKLDAVIFNTCVYKISYELLFLQFKEYYCIKNEEEEEFIKDIQYVGDENMIIETNKTNYVIAKNKLKHILPKTNYYLVDHSNWRYSSLQDLSWFMINREVPSFNYNVGINIEYFLLARHDETSENGQKVDTIHTIRTIPYYDFRYIEYKTKTNETSIYVTMDIENVSLYVETINEEQNDFDYTQFDTFQGNWVVINSEKRSIKELSQNFIYINAGALALSLMTFFYIIYTIAQMRSVKAKLIAYLFPTELSISSEQFNKKYTIYFNQSLGAGSFGEVFKVKNRFKDAITNPSILKNIPTYYACKQIIFQDEREEYQYQINNEVKVLERLKNYENVIKLINYNIQDMQTLIILELADSSLQDQIRKKIINYQKFNENEIVSFLSQIGMTLANIYQNESITHQDLKPTNILIKNKQYYLADFGSAKQLMLTESYKKNQIGTTKWMSPEALYEDLTYSVDFFKSDIFSLGMILLYMMTLMDISTVNSDGLFRERRIQILQSHRKDIHPNIHLLVQKMLEYDPDKRPDASILKKTIGQLEKIVQEKEINKNKIIESQKLQKIVIQK